MPTDRWQITAAGDSNVQIRRADVRAFVLSQNRKSPASIR